MAKPDQTTISVSKNMARVLRQIKNTEEYRSMNAMFKDLLANSDINFEEIVNQFQHKKEEQQNGTTGNEKQRDEQVSDQFQH